MSQRIQSFYRFLHPEWRRFFRFLSDAADSPFPVNISGGQGTGKEFCVKLLMHTLSIPESKVSWLNASEFEPALVHRLSGSSMVVFSQEGELEIGVQARINEFVNSHWERTRVVWISKMDMQSQLEGSSMIPELYYALNIHDFRLPGLRAMADEMQSIASFFIENLGQRAGRIHYSLTAEQVRSLAEWNWTGNLDELQFILKRSVARTHEKDGRLNLDMVATRLENGPSVPTEQAILDASLLIGDLEESVNQFKKQLVIESIRRAGGNKSNAAKVLGISKAYIFRLIHMLDIKLD